MEGGFKSVAKTGTFERDYKRLSPELKRAVDDCIRDLYKSPIPSTRRAHRINDSLPKVFSVDVTSNKAYKLSFQIEGEMCILRRVGTHAQIDRSN
jgi:mRNA-degrading endonuclease YafQ of YafQ-DinJ toxin-antitoxin module